MKLGIATYNIHKGLSHFNRRMMVHELRDRLRGLKVDIAFLQEVQGVNQRHQRRFHDWPNEPQYEFLADQIWPDYAYGRNAVYDHGHHGNAILSRYPIVSAENQDVSDHRYERRGLLHCEIDCHGRIVHCVCVHLALHEGGRRRQLGALIDRLIERVPADAPLLVAGDFNDWRNNAGRRMAEALGMSEAFRDHAGHTPRTFPSGFPVLRLDRIYVRGFEVHAAAVHHGAPWSRISDHAALSAHLELP
jgi:endonuclease/exonuclease/phosphatase family metal-dependent hydrolase